MLIRNWPFLENLLYCSEGESIIRYAFTKTVYLIQINNFLSVHYSVKTVTKQEQLCRSIDT
jgi:hypothetical protein